MFEWFKRLLRRDAAPTAEEIARARASKRRKPANAFRATGPAPLPMVTGEGNSQDDWSEWESSMMGLDSQMPDMPQSARIYEKESSSRYSRAAPLVDDESDSFGKAGKNRDI
ncbi:MAG TPA: hypothetical protein VMZ74_07340 [Ramlibacter sp.]|nr:hypothetical protein [Ramlibacter sp.]